MKKVGTTTDPTNIKKIIKYKEQLYSVKFGNLDKMDKFLQKHNF